MTGNDKQALVTCGHDAEDMGIGTGGNYLPLLRTCGRDGVPVRDQGSASEAEACTDSDDGTTPCDFFLLDNDIRDRGREKLSRLGSHDDAT